MYKFEISRRQALISGAAAGAALMVGGGSSALAGTELVWSTWETNGREDLVIDFEKATGNHIRQAFLSSEDAQFAALKTGAAKDWDVVNPGLNGAQRYISANVLKPLDTSKMPNLAHMYPDFQAIDRVKGADGKTYLIPYLWGLNPIVYRTDKISDVPTYSTLFDPKYKGKLAMRDYALESVAIAGLHLGVSRDKVFSMSDAELAEAKKVLIAQKPLLRTYWSTIGDLVNLFATDEVDCAFCWRVPYDALHDKKPVAMAKPAAGIFGWCDCFAIPASLPDDKYDAALAFGNYLLGPEYAKRIAIEQNYATTTDVVRNELTKDQQTAIFIDDLSVMKSFMWPVVPPNYSAWVKLWNEVKAA
jgi:spermidine/putrescine-binding protein